MMYAFKITFSALGVALFISHFILLWILFYPTMIQFFKKNKFYKKYAIILSKINQIR